MTTRPTCLLYSCDEMLNARLVRIASGMAAVHPVETRAALEQWFSESGDAVLLADLRAPDCLEVLAEIRTERPLSVVIAMGADRSDPMLAAELLDPFAAIGLHPERREFQRLLKHAAECFRLRQSTRLLNEEIASTKARQSVLKPEAKNPPAAPLQHFSKAQRNFDNLERLFDSVVDGLVDTARVSRAGIFSKPDTTTDFIFQAGTRCHAATRQLVFHASQPLVLWLESHAHLVSRQTLENIEDIEERAMLRQALDALGAEIIIPLHAGGRLLGWIFVGRHATGIPFDLVDLEELTDLADHISTTLEKALQYEQTALQKALAETLLHSIPFGIIACDENAVIRWFNSAAREILMAGTEEVIGKPVEALGSQMADLLHRALAESGEPVSKTWTDPRTKRTLSAETRGLMDGGFRVGAMMMVHDVTGAQLLKEKEEQLERTAFWTDLAAGMSHEIRNPLVAIKTFSQLLPERYDDPDFRAEFGEQVAAEVDKLNQIVDKINSFADLPQLAFKPLDIRKPIEHAVTRIQSDLDHDHLRIHLSSDDSALKVNGDIDALEECIYHLLRNAAENLDNKENACIKLTVRSRDAGTGASSVFVIINDNGSGIDEAVRDKLFSPFSTTKARGLGLGLPIAKRAVIDHNGQMDIHSDESGTTVTICLPAAGDG